MASGRLGMHAVFVFVCAVSLAAGCSSGTDGQGADVTVIPAGGDSGLPGEGDTGGTPADDAGSIPDTGAGADVSSYDTSFQPDAGELPDVGGPDDAGALPEAGSVDAGEQPDAGQGDDAGGIDDAGADDAGTAVGTKTAGQSCADHAECVAGAQCVAGEYTQAHCNPGCATDADCSAVAQGAKGTCADVGGASFKICIWWCFGGGVCPGDLECDGAACR